MKEKEANLIEMERKLADKEVELERRQREMKRAGGPSRGEHRSIESKSGSREFNSSSSRERNNREGERTRDVRHHHRIYSLMILWIFTANHNFLLVFFLLFLIVGLMKVAIVSKRNTIAIIIVAVGGSIH